MGIADEGKALRRKDEELVSTLLLSAPELVICNEEALRLLEEMFVCGVIQVVGKAESGEIVADVLDLFFGLAYFVAGGDGEIVVVAVVDGGGSGGGDADAKRPYCGLTISVVGLSPTHHPEAKRQGVVDPLLGVIVFALIVSGLLLRQAVGSVVLGSGHVNSQCHQFYILSYNKSNELKCT